MSSDCLFCQIATGQLPSTIVYQDDQVVAFNDIHPAAPVHVLLVPRQHIISIADATEADREVIDKLIWQAKVLAEKLGIAELGYRLVFNVRSQAGQAIDHLHLHLLGGGKLGTIV